MAPDQKPTTPPPPLVSGPVIAEPPPTAESNPSAIDDDATAAAAVVVLLPTAAEAEEGLRSRVEVELDGAERAARPSAVVGVVGVPSPAREVRPQNLVA